MDSPLPRWLRIFFLIVALQAFLLFIALIQPSLINLVEPWPASPLNARFIAALYTALGMAVLLCSRARVFREVRIILAGVGLATAGLLVITLYRLAVFGFGELAYPDRFPVGWTLFYLLDPLVVAWTFWRWRGERVGAASSRMAGFWLLQALILGVSGLVLLLTPPLAISLWPWALTPPLSQLYSGFFLTLAVCCWLASREAEWSGARLLTLALALLALLVLAVSGIHLDRFKPGLPTLIWFALFGAEALAFILVWLRHAARQPRMASL